MVVRCRRCRRGAGKNSHALLHHLDEVIRGVRIGFHLLGTRWAANVETHDLFLWLRFHQADLFEKRRLRVRGKGDAHFQSLSIGTQWLARHRTEFLTAVRSHGSRKRSAGSTGSAVARMRRVGGTRPTAATMPRSATPWSRQCQGDQRCGQQDRTAHLHGHGLCSSVKSDPTAPATHQFRPGRR